MKKIAAFACFLLFSGVTIVACNKDSLTDDGKQRVSLYGCREQVNGLPGTRICFDSLVADSRCPENVQCVWEGYAIVKVSFYENNTVHRFRMSLWRHPFVLQQFNAVHDTTINGYKVAFTELSGTNKPPAEAEAVFDVSR